MVYVTHKHIYTTNIFKSFQKQSVITSNIPTTSRNIIQVKFCGHRYQIIPEKQVHTTLYIQYQISVHRKYHDE